MSWGVFEIYDRWGRIEEIHIVPSTKEGRPYVGHTISCFCDCCPTVDLETEPGKPPIFHHHQIH